MQSRPTIRGLLKISQQKMTSQVIPITIIIGPGSYYIEGCLNLQLVRRNPKSQGKQAYTSLNRTAYGFTNRQDEYAVGPCSYTPNITVIKRRSPALIKYSLPEDQRVAKRMQSYIDNAQRMPEQRNLEDVSKNTPTVAGGSCSFMSKVRKETAQPDQDFPGPGFYHKKCEYLGKGATFATAKKSTKIVNYNNALIIQTHHEVSPGVGTYHKKSAKCSAPSTTFQCSYLF
eukprot:TRINITY_DN4531_c0_g2_i5.p1 TRINITY_DN4531_c0_g2~~TRINITY_DN4531_c0_g2_i5.p1  ORF type:complete len:229 (+),score=21.39 TRINITY_DN4531_c0_g2_i5:455-1141(+)